MYVQTVVPLALEVLQAPSSPDDTVSVPLVEQHSKQEPAYDIDDKNDTHVAECGSVKKDNCT
eukprot:SAG31_NODE_5770_length_2334_cov_19.937808_1_plen_62_part_00